MLGFINETKNRKIQNEMSRKQKTRNKFSTRGSNSFSEKSFLKINLIKLFLGLVELWTLILAEHEMHFYLCYQCEGRIQLFYVINSRLVSKRNKSQ